MMSVVAAVLLCGLGGFLLMALYLYLVWRFVTPD